MQKKAYNKSIIREILSSKARFLSILAIIFLGVAFYSGIKASGPDMELAIDRYFSESHLMDSKIVSTLGINEDDLKLLQDDETILDYYATHSIDANVTNQNSVVKFMEYNPASTSNMNTFTVVEGRLPENEGEIALDYKIMQNNQELKIGDEYEIESDEATLATFNRQTYKIVGFVKSPMYIDKESRGNTTVGKGSIDYFAVVNSSDISMPVYTEVYVRFKNVENLSPYSDAYRDKMEENNKYLEKLFKEGYYFFDRDDNPGYSTYGNSIQSLDKIATVLPVFFFLVAVLICLTTMTRMVEEKRTEIGTLKALGYHDLEISKKYVIYAALASIVGAGIGILVGSTLIPYIINNAYGEMFVIPDIRLEFYPSDIIQSFVISILCTVGAAIFVLEAELKENPSVLMRVKSPKIGKKILFERITPLWKRLNFNYKVTFRNLFRYKQRMIMTILGIAGCMALLVTGFALNKSNEETVKMQFDKLLRYDAMVVFNDGVNKEEDEAYSKMLNELEEYESSLDIHQEAITFSKKGMNKQSAMMYVPKDVDQLSSFVLLNDRETGKEYSLSNSGVVISEKLAKLLNASVGDLITLNDADENAYEVKVDHIAENYFDHYIYLSPTYYEQIFNKDVTFNAQLINLKSYENDDIQTKLMNSDKVMNVTLMSEIKESSGDSSLKVVLIFIIVSSGCLAFIVLYNLININVSERIRELSTIKVLGFFDNEVTMYIFRENIILTLLGILTGSVMGKFLYNFIVNTAETDPLYMIRDVYMSSYIISGCITFLFAILVMIMMHVKLKNVNMIDALKSVD
ncbi:ABC transporter permease [Anaerosporobacter sp.]